jgi:protein phosphatase
MGEMFPNKQTTSPTSTRPLPSAPAQKSALATPSIQSEASKDTNALYNLFINNLLRPEDWNTPANSKFSFRREHVYALIEEFETIIKNQPMVLKLRAPIKIFGDVHGQYCDLMRFFDLYGSPSDKK